MDNGNVLMCDVSRCQDGVDGGEEQEENAEGRSSRDEVWEWIFLIIRILLII